jgi:hypothetical protein
VAGLAVACGATLVASVVACGPARASPTFDPEEFLRVGVDVRQECEALVRSLARAGLRLRRRVDGPRSCAFESVSDDGLRTAVRVVTARGGVLGRDGGGEGFLRTPRVSLVVPPRAERAAEILVAREDEERGRQCLEIVVVDAGGLAREVPVVLDDAEGDAPCVEEVRAIAGDPEGRVEAITVVSIDGLPVALRPAVRVPLAVDGRRLVYAPPNEASLRAEIHARAAALDAARVAHDTVRAFRLGVELALCALLSGEPLAAAQAHVDHALQGLDLTPELGTARDVVAHGLGRVAERIAARQAGRRPAERRDAEPGATGATAVPDRSR